MALLIVAGTFALLSRERATRQFETGVRITDALDESERLYRDGKVPEALMAARRAGSLVATGPGNTAWTDSVRDRVTDLETVLKLDDNFFEAFATDGYPEVEPTSVNDGPSRYAEFERLFSLYGIDLSAQSAEEAAARIRGRMIAVDLAAALDRWANIRILADAKIRNDSFSRKLISTARLADPDPWRDRVREAYEGDDTAGLEELSRTAPVEDLPRPTLRVIGQTLYFRYPYGRPADAARQFLRRAQKRHPDDLWLNFLLADSLYSHRPPGYGEALGFFRAVLALRPNIPWVYLRVAQVTHWQGNRSGAIAYYQEAHRLKPDWALPVHQAGVLLLLTGHPDESIPWARKAIELAPRDSSSQLVLGTAFLQKGLVDEAIVEIRKAIELDPQNPHAHNKLGRALTKKGQVAEAIRSCRKAMALDPHLYGVHTTLCEILYGTGRTEEAIALCRDVIRRDPKNDKAHFDLGYILERQGHLDEAIACYRKADALSPSGPGTEGRYLYCLGQALRSSGRLSEAILYYRQAIDLDPGIAAHYESLGQALKDAGNLDEAVSAYRKAVELDSSLARRAEIAELLNRKSSGPK
jgi:tetratricopeptide (TPR) repeat protein